MRLHLNEGLDVLEPADIFLSATPTSELYNLGAGSQFAYLLLLVLGVLRDERSEAVVDPTLREELFKLFLNTDVERVELPSHTSSAPTLAAEREKSQSRRRTWGPMYSPRRFQSASGVSSVASFASW